VKGECIMTKPSNRIKPVELKRIKTGITELDQILNGGIPEFAITVIGGPAGCGKTVLAQQTVFNNATEERKAPYIVTVSEPTVKMLRYQQQFSFYDQEKIDLESVIFIDMGEIVKEGGLDGIYTQIKEYLDKYQPRLLVIDSFKAINEIAANEPAIRKFGYDLSVLLTTRQCTTLLVGEYEPEDLSKVSIFAIADVIIMLDFYHQGMFTSRTLEVVKMRGSKFFQGKHPFGISNEGIHVYPRITTPEEPVTQKWKVEKVGIGITGADDMMEGGLQRGSITLLAGAAGTGKTLMGLHFIVEGAKRGEPGVFVTFQETPDYLRFNSSLFGWDLEKLEKQGLLKILYSSPVELGVDEHTMVIRKAINDISAKRVVIDSLMDIEIATVDKVRFKDYVYSLAAYFRSQQITAIVTNEIPELFGSVMLSLHGISFISDAVILLRYVEVESNLLRALSILKMRGSQHIKDIREYEINDAGLHIKGKITGYTALLTGRPGLEAKTIINDIDQPLTYIAGMAELLMETKLPKDHEKIIQDLKDQAEYAKHVLSSPLIVETVNESTGDKNKKQRGRSKAS
jgi:circadian clock protein KaiC